MKKEDVEASINAAQARGEYRIKSGDLSNTLRRLADALDARKIEMERAEIVPGGILVAPFDELGALSLGLPQSSRRAGVHVGYFTLTLIYTNARDDD